MFSVQTCSPSFGCDPEYFFMKGKTIIPSDKVIPPTGLPVVGGMIVRDGIQGEFTTSTPQACRANVSNEISSILRGLQDHVRQLDPEIKVSFATSVLIPPKQFAALDPNVRQLGCMPSLNIYDKAATVGVDGNTYRRRSAGGHIHIGLGGYGKFKDRGGKLTDIGADLIKILDIVVGNTCVLVDRDPGAAARRAVYGKAGEYRLPSHGVEYRTLSNFWMKSYPLMSMAFGLARLATSLAYTDSTRKELLKVVDQENVCRAIQTNRLEPAWENFEVLAEFLKQCDGLDGSSLSRRNLVGFRQFAKTVQEKGLEHYFPEDPVHHWVNKPEGHVYGTAWESWLATNILVPTYFEQRIKQFNAEYRRN